MTWQDSPASGGKPINGSAAGFSAVSYTHLDVYKRQGVALAVAAKGGATYLGAPAALTFNALGQPSAGVVIAVTDLAGVPITVESETGYAH